MNFIYSQKIMLSILNRMHVTCNTSATREKKNMGHTIIPPKALMMQAYSLPEKTYRQFISLFILYIYFYHSYLNIILLITHLIYKHTHTQTHTTIKIIYFKSRFNCIYFKKYVSNICYLVKA